MVHLFPTQVKFSHLLVHLWDIFLLNDNIVTMDVLESPPYIIPRVNMNVRTNEPLPPPLPSPVYL